MTRQETAAILKVIKIAYPGFYSKLSRGEMEDWLSVWTTMFADDDPRIVTEAVKDLIQTHTGFPPEIADVKTKMKEIIQAATGEPTDEELWIILRRALADGIYGAKEQYESLPPVLKSYVRDPSQLREMATMDTDVIDSVVHGQFLKQIPAIRKAQEYRDSLPEPLKEYIAAACKRIPDEKKPDMIESNEKRNKALLALEGVNLL